MKLPRKKTKNHAIDETFKEVERLIQKLVNRFLFIYNVDKEEILSAAYLGFVQAYHTFEYSRNLKFTTWVWQKVKNRMLDVLRKDIQNRKVQLTSLEEMDFPDKKIKFNAFEFLDTLSSDARKVANLALNSPPDIWLIFNQLGEKSDGNFRRSIRIFLQEVGWDAERIKDTFNEIKEKLSA